METTLQRIKWKDTNKEEDHLFGIGIWDGSTNDDHVFFWVESMKEITENSFDEFVIICNGV